MNDAFLVGFGLTFGVGCGVLLTLFIGTIWGLWPWQT